MGDPRTLETTQERLELIGLSLRRMLVDLEGAYSAASKLRAYAPAPSYGEWIQCADTLTELDHSAIRRHIASFAVSPRFILLVAETEGDEDKTARSLESTRRQLYQNVDVRVLKKEQFDSYSPGQAGNAYIAIIQAGDVLSEHALYWMASVIESSFDVGLVYSDEDRLNEAGTRCGPKFKPDW